MGGRHPPEEEAAEVEVEEAWLRRVCGALQSAAWSSRHGGRGQDAQVVSQPPRERWERSSKKCGLGGNDGPATVVRERIRGWQSYASFVECDDGGREWTCAVSIWRLDAQDVSSSAGKHSQTLH